MLIAQSIKFHLMKSKISKTISKRFVVFEENIKNYLDMLCLTKVGIWEIDRNLIAVAGL